MGTAASSGDDIDANFMYNIGGKINVRRDVDDAPMMFNT